MYVLQKRFTKMKPYINSFEVHPQLTHKEHLVDVELLVGAGFALATKMNSRFTVTPVKTFLKIWVQMKTTILLWSLSLTGTSKRKKNSPLPNLFLFPSILVESVYTKNHQTLADK